MFKPHFSCCCNMGRWETLPRLKNLFRYPGMRSQKQSMAVIAFLRFVLFCFPSVKNVLPVTSLCGSNCRHVNSFFICCVCSCIIFVYMCLSVPSTRRSHHPASIHHSPPTSHPSRYYCTIRHPRLRPHSHWQQRYSTAPRVSTTSSACSFIFQLHSRFHFSVFRRLSSSLLQASASRLMWTLGK